jgi:hypothetical protein
MNDEDNKKPGFSKKPGFFASLECVPSCASSLVTLTPFWIAAACPR